MVCFFMLKVLNLAPGDRLHNSSSNDVRWSNPYYTPFWEKPSFDVIRMFLVL